MFKSRYVLWQLTWQEVRARYRRSLLGIVWAAIQPLALMAVLSVVFVYFFVPVGTGGKEPYPIFLFVALAPWTAFSIAVTRAVSSLVRHGDMVRRVHFPREALVLAAVGASFVEFVVAMVVCLGLMYCFDISLTWQMLWLIPLALVFAALAAGVSFFGAALNVFWRDVGVATPFLLQVWFFASPIIYPWKKVPERLVAVYALNPIVGLVAGMRRSVLRGLPPDSHTAIFLGVSAAISVGLCFLGYRFFKRVEVHFSDVV